MEVGTAYVRVRALTNQLSGEIRTGLAKAAAGVDAQIPVFAATEALREDLAVGVARAKEGQQINIPVDATAAGLREDLFRTTEEAATGQQINVPVDADGTGLREDVTRTALEASAGQRINIPVHADTKGTDFGKIASSLRGGLVLALKGTALGFAGVGAAAAGAAYLAGNFQKQINVLGAVSGTTGAKLKELSGLAITLGKDARLPGTSAQDAAEALTELSKAGLSVKDAMAAARPVLELSAAAQVDNATAATITATALNSFHLEGTQAQHVANLLAGAANASAGEVTDMAQAMQFAGSAMHTAGQSVDDTATAIAIMSNAGISGSVAGTSLAAAFKALEAPSTKAQAVMKQFGINIYDAKGQMLPMRDIIKQMSGAFQNLTPEVRQHALQTIFGSRAIQAANIVLTQGTDKFDKMSKGVHQANAAQKLAEAQTKGFAGALNALKSNVETVAIQIGLKLLPAATDAANALSDVVGTIGDLATAPSFDAFGKRLHDAIFGAVPKQPIHIPLGVNIGPAGTKGPSLLERLGLGKETADQVNAFMARIGGLIARAAPVVLSAFRGIAGGVKELIVALLPLQPFFENILVPILEGLAKSVVGTLVVAFKILVPAIGLFARALGFIGKAAEPLRPVFVILGELLGLLLPGAILKIIGLFGRFGAALLLPAKIGEKIGGVFRALAAVFGPLARPVGLLVEQFGALRFAGPLVASVFTRLVSGSLALVDAFGAVSDAAGGLYDAVTGAVSGIVDFVGDHWRVFASILGGPIAAAAIQIVAHFGAIKRGVTAALHGVAAAFNVVKHAVSEAISFVREHWRAFAILIGGPVAAAAVLVKDHLGAIRRAVSAAWAFVRGVTTAAWSAVRNAVVGGMSRVVGAVRAGAATVRGAVSRAWDTVESVTRRAWNSLRELVAGALRRVAGAVRSIGGDIVDAAKSIGQRIVNGVIDGVGSLGSRLKGAIEDKVRSGLDSINPFSPVEHGGFIHIGEPIVKGALAGVAPLAVKLGGSLGDAVGKAVRGARQQADQMRDVGTRIKRGVLDGMDGLSGAMGRVWATIHGKSGGAWSGIYSTIHGWVGRVIGSVNNVLSSLHLARIGFAGGGETPSRAAGGPILAGAADRYGLVQPVPGGVYRVAEAQHPEMVIPLDPARKTRAKELLEVTAKRVGLIPQYADGGEPWSRFAKPHHGRLPSVAPWSRFAPPPGQRDHDSGLPQFMLGGRIYETLLKNLRHLGKGHHKLFEDEFSVWRAGERFAIARDSWKKVVGLAHGIPEDEVFVRRGGERFATALDNLHRLVNGHARRGEVLANFGGQPFSVAQDSLSRQRTRIKDFADGGQPSAPPVPRFPVGTPGDVGRGASERTRKEIVAWLKAHLPNGKALAEAIRITNLHLPYVWGGGHVANPLAYPQGTGGGFDCSGFVSRVLEVAGAMRGPAVVSGVFSGRGKPGEGALRTYSNSEHVYMGIGDKTFGTSSYNPGGGAGGPLPYGARSGFDVRHYADGGIVPGTGPRLSVTHGGETVIPTRDADTRGTLKRLAAAMTRLVEIEESRERRPDKYPRGVTIEHMEVTPPPQKTMAEWLGDAARQAGV